MRHAVPIEYLLFLLSADAVVLVQEVEEWALGFFERGIGSGLEVSQIREDTLLELLRVFDRATEGLESKGQASHDIRARDVKEVVPVTNQRVRLSLPIVSSTPN